MHIFEYFLIGILIFIYYRVITLQTFFKKVFLFAMIANYSKNFDVSKSITRMNTKNENIL